MSNSAKARHAAIAGIRKMIWRVSKYPGFPAIECAVEVLIMNTPSTSKSPVTTTRTQSSPARNARTPAPVAPRDTRMLVSVVNSTSPAAGCRRDVG